MQTGAEIFRYCLCRAMIRRMIITGLLVVIPGWPYGAVGQSEVVPGVGEKLSPDFVAGFEDLPLAPGVENLSGSQTVFDSSGGRVIDARAFGPVSALSVRRFYRASLPQLGWRIVSGERFVREGEILTIDVEEDPPGVQLRFTLTPLETLP